MNVEFVSWVSLASLLAPMIPTISDEPPWPPSIYMMLGIQTPAGTLVWQASTLPTERSPTLSYTFERMVLELRFNVRVPCMLYTVGSDQMRFCSISV